MFGKPRALYALIIRLCHLIVYSSGRCSSCLHNDTDPYLKHALRKHVVPLPIRRAFLNCGIVLTHCIKFNDLVFMRKVYKSLFP
jgi:hypothetical protein